MTPKTPFIVRSVIILTISVFALCATGCRKKDVSYCSQYKVQIKSSLNVRSEPAATGKIVGSLHNNEIVWVYDINNGWAKILYGYHFGYVSTKYITPTDANAIIPDRSNEAKKYEQQTKVHNNVLLFDKANVLSSQDYAQICKAYADINAFVVIWTADSIDKGDILSYNSDVIDMLEDEPYEKTIEETKPSHIADKNIYYVTFVKDLGLMQASSESKVMKFIDVSMPDRYINAQYKASRNGLTAGMVDFSKLLNDATAKYNDSGWFIRTCIMSASLAELISEDLIKDNVLPSNMFLHRFVFSWLTAIPRNFLNFLIAKLNSLGSVMLLLSILLVATIFIRAHVTGAGYDKGLKKGCAIFLLYILVLFLFTCFVLLILYTSCNITDITAMSMYGWNSDMISTVTQHNLNHMIPRRWWIGILFFIGIMYYQLPNAWISVAATLPSLAQKKLAANNPTHFDEERDWNEENYPYSVLYGSKLGWVIGGSTMSVVVLTLILNGTSMFYATVFAWTLCIGKTYSIIRLYINWKKCGYYLYTQRYIK